MSTAISDRTIRSHGPRLSIQAPLYPESVRGSDSWPVCRISERAHSGAAHPEYSQRVGRVLLLVGLVGLVLSSAWLAFGFYVDAVLGDT